MKHFNIHSLSRTNVLAGATMAMGDLAALLGKLPPPGSPSLVVLDFREISVATASYLREFVIGFRDFTRRNRPDLFPAVANASPTVTEELAGLLLGIRDAIVVCQHDGTRLRKARLLGVLDEKERVTLDAVLDSPDIDAATLMAKSRDSDEVTANAWNNRLAGLVAKRLVIETRNGRTKRFTPVIKELENGC